MSEPNRCSRREFLPQLSLFKFPENSFSTSQNLFMNYCFDALLEFLVETNFVDLGLREKVQTLNMEGN